jgi:hypothetical protein
MLPVLDAVIKEIGVPGLRQFVLEMTQEGSNNWQLAHKYGLSVFQVRVLRQQLPDACQIVLRSEQRRAVILPFNNKSAA